MEKQVSGTVVDGEGNEVGSVSGTYIDDCLDSSSEQIVSRTITITVQDDEGNQVGSGQLQYDDYVSFGSGGTRTINLSGNVQDDEGNVVGSVSGSLEDQYGAKEQVVQTFMQWLPWIIVMMLMTIMISLLSAVLS